MENIIVEYIRPELFILIPVLYLIGLGLKKFDKLNDKYIPVALGVSGICLAVMYVVAVDRASLMSILSGILQGILCAGASVYANQIYKQLTRK